LTVPGSRKSLRSRSPEQVARTRWLHIAALSALVLVVFASSLAGSFVWTDHEDIIKGAYRVDSMADLQAVLTSSREAYRLREEGVAVDPTVGSWQPLAALSYSISWAIWGQCAFCFHLENILLHLLTVIGLYALGRHLLSQRRHGARIAAWTAAIFAVHPATISSVAWIGGRPYLLAGLLVVWSLVLFTRLQATTNAHRQHLNRWLLASGFTALAAFATHESTWMLPAMALLVSVFESRERGRHFLTGIAPVRYRGMLVVLGVLVLVIAYRALVIGGLSPAGQYPSANLLDNVGTALRHFWYLVESTLLPGEPVVSDAWRITTGWTSTEVAALLGVLVATVALAIGLRMNHPSAFGVAWFIVWILPTVGVVPSNYYHNPHGLYLASWGLVFALSYAIFIAWRPLGRQLLPGSEVVVYAPIILVLGFVTALSNARWWDGVGLFESEIAHDPHYIEGRLRLADAALQSGDPERALTHVLAAIESSQAENYTGYWSPRDGYFLLGRAQSDMALHHDAVSSFRTALEHRPDDAELHHHLGQALLATGDYAQAQAELEKALQLRPAHAPAEADLGVALARQERYTEAYPRLATALDAGLGTPMRHSAMALAMIDAGQLEAAATQLEAALTGKENADDRARLAWVKWRLGRTDAAFDDLSMALQMDEGMTPVLKWVQEQMMSSGPDGEATDPAPSPGTTDEAAPAVNSSGPAEAGPKSAGGNA
jgi:tetratricopeptide (TPR) repeat protein